MYKIRPTEELNDNKMTYVQHTLDAIRRTDWSYEMQLKLLFPIKWYQLAFIDHNWSGEPNLFEPAIS